MYILIFADDIIILASSITDLQVLRGILEVWCLHFRKKISAPKSNVISPNVDFLRLLTFDVFLLTSPLGKRTC